MYDKLSFKIAEDITAGEFVSLNSTGLAVQSAVSDTKCIGVAANTLVYSATVDKYVTVIREDVVDCTVKAAVAPGNKVVIDGTTKTKVTPFVASGEGAHTPDQIIGVALTAADSDGDVIKVLLY